MDTQGSLFAPPAEDDRRQAVCFADIVFDRPLDDIYTYAVPDHIIGDVAVGKRIVAPFGRGDRPAIGYCVGLGDTPPTRKVKEIAQVLDDQPLVTENLLKLTRWLADYYLCGWGQVLNAVVPAEVRERAGTHNIILIDLVPQTLWPNPMPVLTAKQKAVLELLQTHGKPIELKTLGRLAKCGPAPIRALLEKNLAQRKVERVESKGGDDSENGDEATTFTGSDPLILTPDQSHVWSSLEKAVHDGGFRPFLLHGVTGSGKTELYMRAIAEVVKKGQEALVLVPEISLTPQTIQQFRTRWEKVAVLHSHLQAAQRGSQWRQIAAGQVQVVVGARSAVFAPTRRLGLIVVDEEHETSFKQELTPRYHGRDVAMMRARMEGVPIILGSATPSLESWYNAERGQYTLLSLPRRVAERPLPHVALIDLRHDRQPDRRLHGLSPSLERAMTRALREGGQVMLLLNRRGFSTHIHCPACGHVEQCKFCDLALTYHRERDMNLCHYCGFEELPRQQCPQCGLGQIRFQGLGTEKLHAEIEAKFPDYQVRRMDSDTMRRPGSHERLLDSFRRGEIHILLGTQMIAKGLDFPNVTLVGVVNADVGLHRADFRASERTFQLLAQVAGRTGRGPRGGLVLVQTYTPEHPSISLASRHDYLKFAEGELKLRRAHGYPPYQRLARIVIRGRDMTVAAEVAERLAGAFRVVLEKMAPAAASNPTGSEYLTGGLGGQELRLLGPAEAEVFRLKGHYRYHFQLQSASSAQLHQVLRQVLPVVKLPRDVQLTVDIDPHDML